jgi:hypothetical protein
MPRAAAFLQPTANMMANHPFGGPAEFLPGGQDITGIPMGKFVFRNAPWYFDPFLLKADGAIASYNGLVIGNKGMGKTTILKLIAYRLPLIGAGNGFMRCAINDHRPEGGRSEYARLGDALNSEVFDIANHSVNPFESELKLGDLSTLEMALMLCEHVNKAPLIGSDFEALKVAVWMMLGRSSLLWSIETLMQMCLLMTSDDVKGQQENMDTRMKQRLEQRIEKFAEYNEASTFRKELEGIYREPGSVNIDEIMHSRFHIASLLGTLVEGKYGRMLGGGDSLYRMLSQPVVINDWRGVTRDAVGLMRAIYHRIQINAIEQELHHLYPNIELDDEDHQSMDELVYAKSKALKSKIARSARLLSLSGSHRLSDYRKGGAGSELERYGDSILKDMDFFLVGRQANNKEDLDELRDRLNLTSEQRTELTTLDKYIFGMKMGETEPWDYVQATPNDDEEPLIRSNRANDFMIDRPGLDPSRLEEVAAATNKPLKAME